MGEETKTYPGISSNDSSVNDGSESVVILEERIKNFQKEYKELVEKYQIDFSASVQPVMRLIDLKKPK